MAKKKTRRRKAGPEPGSRGLAPGAMEEGGAPAPVRAVAGQVKEDGGVVLSTYRDPLGGRWQLLVGLPLDQVAPTPFQRDLSEPHVKRLVASLEGIDRFLDPLIVVREGERSYWTPNGNHRLAALRALGARSVVALLVPERDVAYRILALNTEKAHNLREKALEVIRMARDLAAAGDARPEQECVELFEEPAFLTLGACYERKARFPGSVYQPFLKRADGFLDARLADAVAIREERAARLLAVEVEVARAVGELKERGLESPYLKNFVVARINPLRFARAGSEGAGDFDASVEKMLRKAEGFDASKVRAEQVAKTGGG